MTKVRKIRFLSGNTLKILAAVAMLIDHVGLLFFPLDMTFRIIGRISFPIFAFLLAEGCKYTRNKTKHFLLLFGLTAICQFVYSVMMDDDYLCVLVTLCLGELNVFAGQYLKKTGFNQEKKADDKIFAAMPLLGTVALTFIIDFFFRVEYGFWGAMLPAVTSVFDFKNINVTAKLKKLDNHYVRLLCFVVGIVLMTIFSRSVLPKEYAFFAILPLLFYNEQRGKYKLKYFFYLFYPLHLVLLEGLYMLLYILSIS